MTKEDTRRHVAAEVRAEMARQRKTVDNYLVPLLRKSRNGLYRKWRGDADFSPAEIWTIASDLGVPVGQFLPDGYVVIMGPSEIGVAS